MDAKDLRTETTLSERNSDGRSKFTQSATAQPCNSNKGYENMPNNPLAKVETPISRPCAVIGPDRIVPPPSSADAYLKKGHYEPWPPMDIPYRQPTNHPPEYPHKMQSYISPLGNISPRQTFQENMPRIMVQPTYNSKINDDASYALDRSMSKSNKINGPSEPKYCDVPYVVNHISNDQKNAEICVPNVNNARNYQQMWHPAGVNMRPARPYGAPELYQFPEYPNCAGPRPVPMSRPHRTISEDPGHIYSDTYYHESNIRYKPYPNIKDRYPQPRYEYVSNYANPFHPPHPFPPYKYDMQKTLPPHIPHPQIPMKYIDNRMSESIMDNYQRPTQGPYNPPYRNQVIHPTYGPIMGNNLLNKVYSYTPEGPIKPVPANKLPYDNKLYVDYDGARNKGFPVSENFYDMRHIKNQVIVPNYPGANMQPIPHPYYRKENLSAKNLEYLSHLRHLDPTMNQNAINKLSSQFSPTSIAISPSDSNTSNDTAHTQGGSLEDCGYVSQSSTASMRSVDSGINRIMPNEFHRRYNYAYPPNVRTSPLSTKQEINSNNGNKNKKNIDVRQFLQMWNEGDEENAGNAKEAIHQTDYSNAHKLPSQYEVAKNHEQLYVLGLMNVPSEELGKYEHIQKVSKLPENIKGYNNIELLKHFEEAIESSNLTHLNHKHPIPRNYQMLSKPSLLQALPPRPLSPLDVEAKISQSVIHKEVGCNFEIKPCSPEMLNVEVATPAQNILNERTIEKVTNPLVVQQPMLSETNENEMIVNVMKQNEHSLVLNESNKIPSCKMINTQCSNTDATNVAKSNYSLQDLESNSGVCLASLPRLDNDIELNFPEVNQQFINANKESVITATESSRQDNIEEISEDFDTASQVLITLESDKEISKLSKYRKIKKVDASFKDKQFQTNSQHLRTDSVIIKNPENIKCMEYNSENPSSDIKNGEVRQIVAQGVSCNLQETGDKNVRQVSSPSSEIAIDFSLHKISNTTTHVAIELNESAKDLQQLNEENDSDHKKELDSCNLDIPVSHMSITSVTDSATKRRSECEIPKENNSIDMLPSSSNVKINNESEVKSENNYEGKKNILVKTLEKKRNKNCNKSVDTNKNHVNSPYTVQCSSQNMYTNFEIENEDLLNTSDVCESTETITIPGEEVGHFSTKLNDNPKVNDDKRRSLSYLGDSVDNISINNDIDNLSEERHQSNFQTQSEKSTILKTDYISTESISDKKENENNSPFVQCSSSNSGDNRILNMESTESISEDSNILNSFVTHTDIVRNENSVDSFVANSLFINNNSESVEITKSIRKSQSEHNISFQTCQIRCDDSQTIINTNQSAIDKDFLSLNVTDHPKLNNLIMSESIEDNENFKSHHDCDDEAQTVNDTNSCTTSFSLDIIGADSKVEELEREQNVPSETMDTAYDVSKNKNNCDSSLQFNSPKIEVRNADITLPSLDNDLVLNDRSQSLKAEMSVCGDENNCNSVVVVSDENVSNKESDCTFTDIKCTPIVQTQIEDDNVNSVEKCDDVSVSEVVKPQTDNYKNDVRDCNDKANESGEYNMGRLVNSSVNGNGFIKTSYKNITMKKELYSPWIQKLFFINEGKCMCNFSSDLQPIENVADVIKNDSSNIDVLSNNENIGRNNLSFRDEGVLDVLKGNHSRNSYGECEIDTSNNDVSNASIEVITDTSTNLCNAEDSGICGIESDISIAETSLRSDHNIMLQVSCDIDCDEDSIEKSLTQIHADSLQEEEDVSRAGTMTPTLSRPCLKRSLSDSALDVYNSENNLQNSKKLKRNNKTFLNVFDIQNNRRNSISSIYNEDNMSFCIVIDENCIITEDIEEDKKICYDITEECLRTHDNDSVNENEAIETVQEIILCPHENGDNNNEYVQPLILEIPDEKSFEESWVDDVACVETVVSDDIAEDVVISAPSSPQDLEEPDYDESNAFNDANDHTEKVKYIYGNKMCNDDADLVDTLYRTPQMNVNRTLASRESFSSDDCDIIDKHAVKNSNDAFSELTTKSEEICILEPSLTNDRPENLEDKNYTDFSNDVTLHYKEPIGEECQNISCTNTLYEKSQDYNANSCKQVSDDLCLKYDESSSEPCVFSSPEVSSTTTDERNSSILLKITNYKGTRISHIDDGNSNKNNSNSCRFTENVNYANYHSNSTEPRPLITKAAQKYIPPPKDIAVGDLKVKLPLPQHSLMKFKQLKISRTDRHCSAVPKNGIPKKPKPLFEDVLKSIDEIQFKKHKEKSKKPKKSVPKVVIKKNENGSHYASTPVKESYNPDLTGRKWQPWVFIEKNIFVDKMATRKKTKAIFSHRKNTYVFADKFKKYKSIPSAKFVISQPKLDDTSMGQFKYTIRLKHSY